jgi:hypothetical protein
MIEPPRLPVLDLKIFAGLGCVALILMILFPLVGVGYVVYEGNRMQRCEGRLSQDSGCAPGPLWGLLNRLRTYEDGDATSTLEYEKVPSIDLGAEGSLCGGTEHFPCLPGLECQSKPDEEYGECVPSIAHDEYAPTSTTESKRIPYQGLGEEGDFCAGSGCSPGFRCDQKPDDDFGTCVSIKKDGQTATTSVKVK